MVKRGLIIGGLIPLLWSFSAFAEGADFSIDVGAASLQLTVPQNIDIELQPTSSAAVFDSRLLTFNVATNNPTGYRVLMSVPQTEMLHSSIVTADIPTLSAASTEADFPANKWGYKTTGDYLPVKLSNEDAAWNNDNPTNGTDHSLTLAAKVDGSQVAGLYTNTLTFAAVANPNAKKDTIVFDANNPNATGSMSSQIVYRGEPTRINKNEFALDGYHFNGWSTKANNTGTGYGDEDIYTSSLAFGADSTTITLYAQWIADTGQGTGYRGKTLQDAYEQAYVNNPGQFPNDEGGYKHGLYVPHKNAQGQYDGTYFEATQQSDYEGIPASDLRFAIQDISLLVDGKNVCERTEVIGSEAYVLDLRDFKSYWVAKLKDGSCWMTQNLDYDIKTSEPITSEYSDINTYGSGAYSSGYSVDARGFISWSPERSTSQDKSTFSCSSYTGYYHPYSIDLGNIYEKYNSNAPCDYSNSNNSCTNYPSTPNPINGQHGHIGNNYNQNAVVATNDSSPVSSDRVMENSICPKGWRLPLRYSSDSLGKDDFVSLAEAYDFYGNLSSGSAVAEPIFFVHTGFLSWATLNWTISGVGSVSGDYWTSVMRSGYAQGGYAVIQNNYLNTGASASWRANGRSIRCIAR